MQKKFSLVGIIFGAILVILGLLVLFGVFGGDANGASGAPYPYDSGYATFGTDFYTYSVNNAQEAASAGRTVAANTRELTSLMKNVSGLFLIAFGVFMVCLFGTKFAALQEDKKAPVAAPQQIVVDELPEL